MKVICDEGSSAARSSLLPMRSIARPALLREAPGTRHGGQLSVNVRTQLTGGDLVGSNT